MPTSDEPWQPLLDQLAHLRAEWPGQEWSWDHRFKCICSSLSMDAAPEMRRLLDGVVPAVWSAETFSSAPPEVKALRERCGDVRPGQLLMTGPTVAGMMPFAMWWPWGDGAKVSARLGIAGSDRQKELFPLLRALFGIA